MAKRNEKELRARIKEIKKELLGLGNMRPGSLSKQYNVCSNPTCRCKDKKSPRKHGPYYQLSYTVRGKHSTEFVWEDMVEEVEEQLRNFRRFRELTQEWVDKSLELARLLRPKGKRRRGN